RISCELWLLSHMRSCIAQGISASVDAPRLLLEGFFGKSRIANKPLIGGILVAFGGRFLGRSSVRPKHPQVPCQVDERKNFSVGAFFRGKRRSNPVQGFSSLIPRASLRALAS